MDIKKVLINKNNGQRLVYVPKKSKLEEGDYVKIIKIKLEDAQ